MREESKRSALKSISWRIVATLTTMILVYVFTGRLEITVGVGLSDAALSTVLYFLHERLWNKIAFGKEIDM